MSAEPMDDLLPLPAVDTVEAMLLSAAGGDQAAFVALKVRMAGLVRVNVRRVLHDASRADAAPAGGSRHVRRCCLRSANVR